MSYKGTDIEDKSSSTPPRAVVTLRESIGELRAAMKSLDHSAIHAGMEQLERDRLRANQSMITLASQGGSREHVQAYSDACQDALQARAEATVHLQRS